MINRKESRLIAQERRNLSKQHGRKAPPGRKPEPTVYPVRAKT